MKDELCAYEHEGLCMRSHVSTTCEIEGCVARYPKYDQLDHPATKKSGQEEPTCDDLEEEIRMVAGDFEQVRVSWNSDFDFIARHFAEWGKKHAGIENKSQSPASADFEEEVERFRRERGASNIRYLECAKHFANWQKQQMMKAVVLNTKVMKDSDGDGIETPYEAWLTLEDAEVTYIPDNIGLNDGDKVKVIIVKEE